MKSINLSKVESHLDLSEIQMTTEAKTVRLLVNGDPHFKVNNALQTAEFTEKYVALAQRLKPDAIINLGDSLDKHRDVDIEPLTQVTECLRRLNRVAPLYILIGNHDRINNSDFLTGKHPFSALSEWPNTTVVDVTKTATIKGLHFVFVPYVPPGRFQEALSTITLPNPVRAYFAHQEFKGAKMGAIRSVVGDPWPLSEPLVVSGHIHDYDRLQGNLIYTGTPMQHAFGDTDDKTVSLFTFNVDEPGHWQEERFDLHLRKLKLFNLSCEEVKTFTPPENTRCKIVIRGTPAEVKACMKLDHVKQLHTNGVKIVYKTLGTTQPERSPPRHDQIRPTLSYGVKLHQAAQKEPDISALYTELFGQPIQP
jgi:DNA repair exonuclease SbcCD nuclease subunit